MSRLALLFGFSGAGKGHNAAIVSQRIRSAKNRSISPVVLRDGPEYRQLGKTLSNKPPSFRGALFSAWNCVRGFVDPDAGDCLLNRTSIATLTFFISPFFYPTKTLIGSRPTKACRT